MRPVLKAIAPSIDILAAPLSAVCGLYLRLLRRYGLERLPLTRRALDLVRVLPVPFHYHEPAVNPRDLRYSLGDERQLPALDLNVTEQLELLSRFHYGAELTGFPLRATEPRRFAYHNGTFEVGDAELFYDMIRHFKPARILEIGSGFSTLIAREAIAQNNREHPDYSCDHVCVEPFENPWLERSGARIVRQRVEDVGVGLFDPLAEADILFIDSSHVIRPQSDVLFEYLELLPRLKRGVLVHIHDIFTPRDYPASWVLGKRRLWNEQYLLEAFLSFNSQYRVLAALNYLRHHHAAALADACPMLVREPTAEPGSFWMVRS